ncbi:EAL domain-containing protein [Clostridium vincentii]|uniref:Cyclic di-GMP phosphodiesterase Gmr n=1 Tax=Clostridium vincentii TaxID=52704 RepID=A0A2T0BFQ9_9CLOT|nr:EAL domain-containing protein [Clostridium vincentii]PRR82662.1 Cyclic di-GMP phosphodiesterase Gmr [Clostridium vincentii]
MLKFRFLGGVQLKNRLLIYMTGLILMSCLSVGITSYFIAKNALDDKGEVILKNGVEMALILIESKNNAVENGSISLEEAQEQVKKSLIGSKNQNGVRAVQNNIDLGKNGYFIAYSKDGMELMHPTLENRNVWNSTDKSNNSFLLVQDQISKGIAGGGYSYYTWDVPNSIDLGKKVSYSRWDENWGWVVTATSYMADYNKGAISIMVIMIFTTSVMLLIGILISIYYIRGVTKPLVKVVENMKLAEKGIYSSIKDINSEDEMGQLVLGFNEMVYSIDDAHQNLIRQKEKIRYLAYYDKLSGLYNRNKFKEHVDSRIKNGCSQAFIILMDIKDFKSINSILGNEFGDQIIKVIGSVFQRLQTENDLIARLSGDEFAAWIETWDESQITHKVDILKEQFAEELKKIGFNQKFYFHISYCAYPEHGFDFESCYKKATVALRIAKENSHTIIYKFKQSMAEALEYEAKIINNIEAAIADEEFKVYYQNKVSIKENKVIGVEALARWNSKELGFISPVVFIPAVDKANMTARFSKMIIGKVLKDYPALEEKFGQGLTVSINISPLFFFEKYFANTIITAVKNSGVNPNKIILEITEDIFINDFKTIRKIIAVLKRFGIKISLDDFGTGYSSLTYVKDIDFDEIKVDKTFIQGLSTDERVFDLLKAIDHIAKAYNYSVVAEGVETKEQLDMVAAAGFDIVQGFIYSKPEPI